MTQTTRYIEKAQNVHGHHPRVNNAANAEPRTLPVGAQAPNIEKTIAFLFPGAYVAPRIANPLGSMMAGPIPWSTRAKVNNT